MCDVKSFLLYLSHDGLIKGLCDENRYILPESDKSTVHSDGSMEKCNFSFSFFL